MAQAMLPTRLFPKHVVGVGVREAPFEDTKCIRVSRPVMLLRFPLLTRIGNDQKFRDQLVEPTKHGRRLGTHTPRSVPRRTFGRTC